MPRSVTRPARDLRLPLWQALIAAALGGVLLDIAFPSPNVWVAAFPGIALTLLALRGRSLGGAILVGCVGGLTFFFLLIQWVSTYLGPVPWIALAAFEGLFFAAGSVAIALVLRWVPRVLPNAWGRLLVIPIAVGGLWTGREYLAGHYPYGGFAWGRIAESQSTSPLASLAAYLGLSGLSFVIVGVVALLVQLALERPMRVVVRAGVAVVACGVLLVVPAWPTHDAGTTTIAAVQGDSKAGFFQQHQYGDLTNAQVEATYEHVPTSKKVDMVVWPEGASDRDPTRDSFGRYAFDTISQRYDAPLVSGVITQKGTKLYNSSIVWQGGKVTAQYDKRHLVPFGEYVPDRPFFNALAPSLVGLLTRDETSGSGANVLTVNGVKAGFAICFDIVDDALTTQMVNGGAKVILAQTNNADFGRSEENTQQLAIARLRAIETSRPLVNISTVGSSAVISADGKTIDSIPAYKPAAMVTKVTLGSGITPAIRFGGALEAIACWLGLAVLVLSGVGSRILPRRSSVGDDRADGDGSDGAGPHEGRENAPALADA
ncbi:apolipoprotein N-acyltransferase [Frondihabitans australicus]|uniref:Apolipoprotein N-acyltransferase n=1 Tax=Frondihabitans australicus TaxID=386892 RepID=A0A495IE14_9MICO|nr:apolipoprotein N-acyltransferase [Frondihabitans australicus]RKR74244.1 apolipoprotein N-acyltransferase [Frondihabitans australicus]